MATVRTGYTISHGGYYKDDDNSGPYAIDSEGNATLIGSSGGSGPGSSVEVSNFPATQPVSATALPLPAGAATATLQTTGNTALGAPANAAWDGVAASAALIPIMKALYDQNATMIGLLNDIKTNTTPAP